jgi:NarL family two-component system response regulator LiaR
MRPLSPREIEVVALVAEGMTNKHIAARLGIGCSTVRVHVSSVAFKLGCRDGEQHERVAVARWWWRQFGLGAA